MDSGFFFSFYISECIKGTIQGRMEEYFKGGSF